MSARRYFANLLVSLLPPTRAFSLKVLIWRLARVDVARDARLVSSVRIWTSGPVAIGSDTFVGHEVMIVGGGASVRIGAKCDIAPRVLLATGTHLDGGRERAAGPGVSHPISIGDGVWIGAASTILGGVEVGDGAMIAAGSLVNRDVPSRVVVAGVPCRVIRERLGSDEIESDIRK
jgi:acetyltransferase-like isoleucine patch superfamily enzyme